MSWIKAISGAAKTLGKDAKVVSRYAKQKASKGLKAVNEFAKDSIEKSPYLTAGATGAAGLGIGAAMGDSVEDISPEYMQIVLELRKQGLSDDQIQEYLDNLIAAQEE